MGDKRLVLMRNKDKSPATTFAHPAIYREPRHLMNVCLHRNSNVKKNNQMLLQKYEYMIPESCGVFARTRNITHKHIDGRLLFAKLVIDFVKGILKLETDHQFTIATSKKNKLLRGFLKKERIVFEGDVYPSVGIDLNDHNNDGLVFPVEAVSNKRDPFDYCIGMLAIDNLQSNNGPGTHWTISLYLYSVRRDKGEIKIKLPVYCLAPNVNYTQK